MPLTTAEKRPLTSETLREQLGRMGGTPFHLGRLENRLEGEVILPMSELNRLRRDLVGQIEQLRALPSRWTVVDSARWSAPGAGDRKGVEPWPIVLSKVNMEHLKAAIPR